MIRYLFLLKYPAFVIVDLGCLDEKKLVLYFIDAENMGEADDVEIYIIIDIFLIYINCAVYYIF